MSFLKNSFSEIKKIHSRVAEPFRIMQIIPSHIIRRTISELFKMEENINKFMTKIGCVLVWWTRQKFYFLILLRRGEKSPVAFLSHLLLAFRLQLARVWWRMILRAIKLLKMAIRRWSSIEMRWTLCNLCWMKYRELECRKIILSWFWRQLKRKKIAKPISARNSR